MRISQNKTVTCNVHTKFYGIFIEFTSESKIGLLFSKSNPPTVRTHLSESFLSSSESDERTSAFLAGLKHRRGTPG